MPDTAEHTVLRRKLAPPRAPKVPGQGALLALLAKTMPRDSDELLSLQLTVADVTPGQLTKGEVIANLQASDLIFHMKSDAATSGLCTVSAGLLSGLIEMQISGRVSSRAALERSPTRVDGIVVSDILDRWIATAKREAQRQEILDRIAFRDHYRAEVLPDPRAAGLALEPGDYATLGITLDLASGTKTGTLGFAVPLAHARYDTADGNVAAEFRDVMMESPASLDVVLTRLERRLAEVRDLGVGDVLEVPIEALQTVTLEGANGDVLANGRLGQAGGQKAVRILADIRGGAVGGGANSGVDMFLVAGKDAGEGVAMPDLPVPEATLDDFPKVPSMTQEVDLPEISDLSDLPELPDLPGLPDLPD